MNIAFWDLHTHQYCLDESVLAIRHCEISDNLFLAMPKSEYISVGIHPWNADLDTVEKLLEYLSVVAQQPNVKLIGECGLDKLKGAEIGVQLKVFEEQIRLAEQLQKPLIIHCVKAYDELIILKKKLKPSVPMIIHGFNKKYALAQSLLKQGFYLSFGAAVFSSVEVQECIKTIHTPFFLETDDKKISIKEIYEKVAAIKQITLKELQLQQMENWKMLI